MLEVIFVFIFVVGISYICLGIAACSHVRIEKDEEKMLAASPWWALYSRYMMIPDRSFVITDEVSF